MIAPSPRYQDHKRQFIESDFPSGDETEDKSVVKRFETLQVKIANVTLAHPVGAILVAVAFGAALGFVTKRLKR